VQNPSSSTTTVTQASAKPSVEQGSGKNAAKNKKKREKEKRKKLAARFLSDLKEQVPSFVSSVREALGKQFGVDVSSLQADHVCYRTDSMEQYTALVDALRSSSDTFTMLVESEVGGRPIATFRLALPITSSDGVHSVNVIEIPSPKQGSPYTAGLEHIEFVIGDGTHMSPKNGQVHQSALKAWMDEHPCVTWNSKAIEKVCNPDVSTKIELPDYGHVSVKFHLISLENVIKVELEEAA
jgi:predicted metalloenzyme YecM